MNSPVGRVPDMMRRWVPPLGRFSTGTSPYLITRDLDNCAVVIGPVCARAAAVPAKAAKAVKAANRLRRSISSMPFLPFFGIATILGRMFSLRAALNLPAGFGPVGKGREVCKSFLGLGLEAFKLHHILDARGEKLIGGGFAV